MTLAESRKVAELLSFLPQVDVAQLQQQSGGGGGGVVLARTSSRSSDTENTM